MLKKLLGRLFGKKQKTPLAKETLAQLEENHRIETKQVVEKLTTPTYADNSSRLSPTQVNQIMLLAKHRVECIVALEKYIHSINPNVRLSRDEDLAEWAFQHRKTQDGPVLIDLMQRAKASKSAFLSYVDVLSWSTDHGRVFNPEQITIIKALTKSWISWKLSTTGDKYPYVLWHAELALREYLESLADQEKSYTSIWIAENPKK